MADDLTLGEAARALDVSVDTVRRWARAGKIETTTAASPPPRSRG